MEMWPTRQVYGERERAPNSERTKACSPKKTYRNHTEFLYGFALIFSLLIQLPKFYTKDQIVSLAGTVNNPLIPSPPFS